MLDDLRQNQYPCIFVEADRMYINYNDDYVQMVQNTISSPLPEIGDPSQAGASQPDGMSLPSTLSRQKAENRTAFTRP